MLEIFDVGPFAKCHHRIVIRITTTILIIVIIIIINRVLAYSGSPPHSLSRASGLGKLTSVCLATTHL